MQYSHRSISKYNNPLSLSSPRLSILLELIRELNKRLSCVRFFFLNCNFVEEIKHVLIGLIRTSRHAKERGKHLLDKPLYIIIIALLHDDIDR